MLFDKRIGISVDEEMIIRRQMSVRIIARKGNKFLMISTYRGDIIFPGGRVENNETFEEAAARELKEETGYISKGKMKPLGRIITDRLDKHDSTCIFETELYFYECTVEDHQTELKLDDKEKRLKIKPIWITKNEILESNKMYLAKTDGADVWIDMVEYVLKHY